MPVYSRACLSRTVTLVVAPSLTACADAFVTNVEAGKYEEDPERGEFHGV